MKNFRHKYFALSVLLWLIAVTLGTAATVQISVLRGGALASGASSQSDAYYADRESVAVRASSGGASVLLTGRNYGEDGAATLRYGLLDGSSLNTFGQPGFVLRSGLTPNALGSQRHTYNDGHGVSGTVNASYLSFNMTAPGGTLFSEIRVDLNGYDFNLPSRIWAGTSVDNYGRAFIPLQSVQTGLTGFSFYLPGLTPSPSLELRIYGLSGADEAQLMNATITATFNPITAVPEPRLTLSLVLLTSLAATRRRRAAV